MTVAVPGRLRASLALVLPEATSEQAALEALFDALAPFFEAAPAIDGERTGALFLLTEDAGSATAVQFWRDALATGPALASPGAFPWCLANAACATLARRFALTGPNVTWLVCDCDDRAAFDAPAAWLVEGLGKPALQGSAQAWLVALRFGAPVPRLMAWHWLASDTEAATERLPAALPAIAAFAQGLAGDWAAAA